MNRPPKFLFVEWPVQRQYHSASHWKMSFQEKSEVKYIRVDDHEKEVRLLKQALTKAQKNPPIV